MTVIFVGILFSYSTLSDDKEQQPDSPPNSEIHVFDLNYKNGNYSLTKGMNISNNRGYDNQPYFTSKSQTLLFVSMRDGKQTDIYEYDLKTQQTNQLTNTPFSEYSPKVSDNNNSITFVSEGGDPYQSVWQMNRKTGDYSWVLNSKEPVGYYHINHNSGDVLFWSRYGWSVQHLNLKRNESRFVSGNAIPSSPKQIPDSNRFSFVHRQTNGEVWIKSFNPKDFSITPIAPIYGNNTDYNWAPNGDILRAEDNILYVWKNGQKAQGWKKVQDLNQYFKGKISRLAISSDGKKIALVENR